MNRLFIHPKEIAQITGKSERAARTIFAKIKKAYNKLPHQMVTIDEFCQYLGIKREEITL